MEIYIPETGRTKMVTDACVDTYRPNCRGCEYNFCQDLGDGGCTKGTAYEGRHYKSEPVNVYYVVQETMNNLRAGRR